MTPLRRFGLLHLLSPVLAALPCLHTRMGDVTRTFSLFGVFGQAQVTPSFRALAPYIVYVAATGIGAAFLFRQPDSPRARRLAIATASIGLLALLDLGWPAFTFSQQATLPFLPPVELRAGIGLWGLLVLQILAVRAARKLPPSISPTRWADASRRPRGIFFPKNFISYACPRPARDPFSENDLPLVYATLATFSLRDQALLTLGLLTGFRARELGAMTIGHVLAEDGSVRSSLALERRHLKHGRGAYRAKVRTRTVPLAPNARAALERYIAERRDEGAANLEAPLFRSRKGFGLSPWQINRIVHRLAEAAGCDANRFYASHSLRKSFAHAVHRACGRDITVTRVALGHHSVLVTQRYIRVEQAEVDAAILAVGSGMAAA